MLNTWRASLQENIEALEDAEMLRQLQDAKPLDGKYISYKGKKLLNLISNDYLGLATDEALTKQFYQQINQQEDILTYFKGGASASRLLGGNHPLYTELEELVAKSYTKESALLFNSGYHANLAILPALFGKGDLIISDKLNHASLIDGMKLSEADFIRFKHLDYNHLRQLLKKKRGDYKNVVLVTESVFSMDGDLADLQALVEIKKEFDTLLYVDEAHAIGAIGEKGLGVCEIQNVIEEIDIIVCPLGKAMASLGALVVMDEIVKKTLVNKARPLIYSTALPPVLVHWTLLIWKTMLGMTEKRVQLQELSHNLKESLIKAGFSTPSQGQIIPVVIGDVARTVWLSKKLEDAGYLALPVRPPTVPPNGTRLRISLTSNIKWEDIQPLTELLKSN